MRDILLLRLRNAIASKEFITARANMETAWYEQWQCDWSEEIRNIDAEIDHLFTALREVEE